MNPIILLLHNALAMTKKCIDSLRTQDVPVDIYVGDNASTDGTQIWLRDGGTGIKGTTCWEDNIGVSAGWNILLDHVFDLGAEHALVINNDVQLPAWFYSTLLSYDIPFVTGVSVGSLDEIAAPPPRKDLVPHPDFSAFLIRRECWETVGPFDDTLVNYCGDLDYHIRAHRAGIHLMNAGLPFYHERSSTISLADPIDRRRIQARADEDRKVFAAKYAKYGVPALGGGYDSMFGPETFGIDRR